jgi:hypothetical protein
MQGRTVERVIAKIGARRHGVVTRRQLLDAGISGREIRHRLHVGSLISVHPGVYRVGHAAPSLEARYAAAVLACGNEALLSGLAAAHLLGLVKGSAPPPEVTAATERRVRGVKTRRRRRMDPRDATVCRGIPVTTVPCTLVALAACLSPEAMARAFHEAGVRHHTTPEQVEAVLERRPNAPGAETLRRVLRGETRVLLSRLEGGFLRVLAEAGLELPETNRRAGTHFVDCRWPEVGLTVELDSYRYHRSRHAWEQDRRREREARARGDEFRRYTYADVQEEPAPMMRELRGLLQGSIRPRRIA